MEKQYEHGSDGGEVEEDDLNLIAAQGALADDRVLAELLRLVPYNGSSVVKAVIPFGTVKPVTNQPPAGIVRPTGSGDGSCRIYAHRAIVGSRTAVGTSGKDNWRDIRSAIHVGAAALFTTAQFIANSSGNPRWDLVYARVDVDVLDPALTRYNKDPITEVITPLLQQNTKQTTVTIGTVTGTPAATPARPATPADAGGAYYIPLAYVYIANGWTITNTLDARAIHDVAPCLGLAPSMGTMHVLPVESLHKPGGALLTALDWSSATGRPGGYLPPTMQGGAERLIPMGWASSYVTGNTLNAVTVLDTTLDWRNRLFQWSAQFDNTGGQAHYAWNVTLAGTRVPSSSFAATSEWGAKAFAGMGQGFFDDATGVTGVAGSIVARFRPTTNMSAMAASSDVVLFVRASDGALCAWCATTDPGGRFFIWLRATGAHPNVS